MTDYLDVFNMDWAGKLEEIFDHAGLYQKRLVDFAPDINHPEYPFRKSNA